jgi:F-type H+-transporting ATPase subunit b
MLNEKFWLAISFLAFVALLAKYVWPHIAKALDESSKKIAADLLAAKEMKERAEKLLANAEQFYKESLAYAEKLSRDAESEAKKIAESAKTNLETEVKKKTDAALNRVKLEEERMIREIKLQIVDSAINNISQNLDLKGGEQEILVEKSIKNLETIQ